LSTKKDKFLESAQKFIAKGQLDRAIKEYAQIVALEPGDIRLRQKLAELLVRVNRKEEAIAEYEVIAKHFSRDLFYLKAIAVYKQVQKLDPANIKPGKRTRHIRNSFAWPFFSGKGVMKGDPQGSGKGCTPSSPTTGILTMQYSLRR